MDLAVFLEGVNTANIPICLDGNRRFSQKSHTSSCQPEVDCSLRLALGRVLKVAAVHENNHIQENCMRKSIIALSLVLCAPVVASAAPNVGGCGLGSKLFAGQGGIAPQVLAVTTNGTSGNQTFGITTGTSGCTQDGVVTSNWKTAMFIDANSNKLARDMSVGEGESLESLAGLLGMSEAEKRVFFRTTKDNFAQIYPTADTSSLHVLHSLKVVLEQTPELSHFASEI